MKDQNIEPIPPPQPCGQFYHSALIPSTLSPEPLAKLYVTLLESYAN